MLAPKCFNCRSFQLLGRFRGSLPAASAVRHMADKKDTDIVIPPEPTTCCMSGCANCVWVEYAETLAKLLGDNDERAREIVLSKITDPNLKAFLSLELRNLKLIREQKASAAAKDNFNKDTPK